MEDTLYEEVYWDYNQDGNHEVFHNVIYVKDSQVSPDGTGLFLRSELENFGLVFTKASIQRMEKEGYHAGFGET